MTNCKVSIILAYLSTIYIISCVIYLIVSRWYGTPFMNAVNKYPELVKIKKKSADKRRTLFIISLGIGIVLMFFLRPFKKC